jgi:ubiquitin carboxyl-terminal hydrolase 4/11/15
MYLTVPLPIAQHREFKLHFVSGDPDQSPVRVRLLISQNASFQAVKEKLGALMKVIPSHVSLATGKQQVSN